MAARSSSWWKGQCTVMRQLSAHVTAIALMPWLKAKIMSQQLAWLCDCGPQRPPTSLLNRQTWFSRLKVQSRGKLFRDVRRGTLHREAGAADIDILCMKSRQVLPGMVSSQQGIWQLHYVFLEGEAMWCQLRGVLLWHAGYKLDWAPDYTQGRVSINVHCGSSLL